MNVYEGKQFFGKRKKLLVIFRKVEIRIRNILRHQGNLWQKKEEKLLRRARQKSEPLKERLLRNERQRGALKNLLLQKRKQLDAEGSDAKRVTSPDYTKSPNRNGKGLLVLGENTKRIFSKINLNNAILIGTIKRN